MEAHRAQRQDRFTLVIHWFDCLLKAGRASANPELPAGANRDRLAACHWHTANPGDIGGGLGSLGPDADGIRLCGDPVIAEVDVVTPGREIGTGKLADANIVSAGGVSDQSIIAAGGIVASGGVGVKGADSIGRVTTPSRVANECVETKGCIDITRRVVL